MVRCVGEGEVDDKLLGMGIFVESENELIMLTNVINTKKEKYLKIP
mgnify:CR=1 FL=1